MRGSWSFYLRKTVEGTKQGGAGGQALLLTLLACAHSRSLATRVAVAARGPIRSPTACKEQAHEDGAGFQSEVHTPPICRRRRGHCKSKGFVVISNSWFSPLSWPRLQLHLLLPSQQLLLLQQTSLSCHIIADFGQQTDGGMEGARQARTEIDPNVLCGQSRQQPFCAAFRSALAQ